VPAYDEPPHRPGAAATRERLADVATAREGLHHAEVTYGHRQPRRRGIGAAWRDFAHRYGWRAYALPVLVVVTIAALTTTHEVSNRDTDAAASSSTQSGQQSGQQSGKKGGAGRQPVAPPVASGSIALKNDTPSADTDVNPNVLAAAALPSGAAYPKRGDGTFRTLPGTSAKVGHGRLFRYSIDVENGMSGVDLPQYEKLVVDTLSDPRSWSGHGVALERVDSGSIDFRVTLTSVMTVRQLCGYTIKVETSCYARAGGGTTDVDRVVLNAARWMRGSTAYVGDLDAYRIYMINHEDGHALGHQHAHQCLPGGLAPVMMQQTFGLKSAASGALCGANPWPYPPGAKGVPGAEQPDTADNDEYGLGKAAD
jgi:hypothetical protein